MIKPQEKIHAITAIGKFPLRQCAVFKEHKPNTRLNSGIQRTYAKGLTNELD